MCSPCTPPPPRSLHVTRLVGWGLDARDVRVTWEGDLGGLALEWAPGSGSQGNGARLSNSMVRAGCKWMAPRVAV